MKDLPSFTPEELQSIRRQVAQVRLFFAGDTDTDLTLCHFCEGVIGDNGGTWDNFTHTLSIDYRWHRAVLARDLPGIAYQLQFTRDTVKVLPPVDVN
jgi:hypothetical protein